MSAVSPATATPKGGTPRLLRRIRTAAVVTMLVLGIAASWLVLNTKLSLTEGASVASATVTASQLRAALENADIAAAGSLGGPADQRPAYRTAYAACLDEAGGLLTRLGETTSGSAGALSEIQRSYTSYVRTVEAALTLAGRDDASAAAQLEAASSYLRSTLDAELVALAKVDSAAAGRHLGSGASGWIAPMAIMALAVLVALSVALALRTHRYLNLGLGGAALAVVAMWLLASSAIGGLTTQGSGAALPQLNSIATMASVQNQVEMARADELQALIARLDITARASDSAAQLASAASKSGVVSASFTSTLTSYTTTSASVFQRVGAGELAAAATASTQVSGPAYTAADDAVASEITHVGDTIASTLNGNDTVLYGTAFALLVLSLAGMVAASLGVGLRVREYR
jgi:hypothetical protein